MFKSDTNEMYVRAVEKHGDDSGAIMAPNHLHQLRLKAAADLLLSHSPPRATILDVGCGMGNLLDHLDVGQYSWYTGIDPSPELLEIAAPRYSGKKNVKFHQSTVEAWTEPSEYVICLGVAAHLIPEQWALNKFAGLLSRLATRGIIVEFQNAETYGGKFTSWTKEQVGLAMGRRPRPAYTVENEGDSVFTCFFSLQ